MLTVAVTVVFMLTWRLERMVFAFTGKGAYCLRRLMSWGLFWIMLEQMLVDV